jgi:AcrR family transcriptional regulator
LSVRTPRASFPPEGPPSPQEADRLKPGRSQSHLQVVNSQRARLQRAMVELAASDGVEAITVRKLTKGAGVSSRAFYARFSGTDDCLLTSYRDIMEAAARRVAATRSTELAPGEQLDVALRALLDHLLADHDVARFALIEIYAGGPAALAAIGEEERRLESVLRGCLDRRSRRVSKLAVAAIVAATLRCARVQLIDAQPAEARRTTDTLLDWARDIVEDKEELGIAAVAAPEASPSRPMLDEGSGASGERDEEDLLLAAVLRLALPDGFHGLTSGKVSSAAGLPAVRFRRHFANLADGYLALIRRTCRSFFIELTADGDPDQVTRVPIRTALQKTSRRAASHPAAARLTFKQIVDAGVAGLTCREALISELAVACSATEPAATEALPIRAESRAAALWATLAETPQRRPHPTG